MLKNYKKLFSLMAVAISAGVVISSTLSFTACSKVSEKDIPMNNNYFDIQDGTLNGFSSNVLNNSSSLKKFNTIRFDGSVFEIASSAFCSTSNQMGLLPMNINAVIFDEKCPVTQVADYAFANNILLKKVILSSKIVQVLDNAFQNCAALANLELGKNVETINDYAFDGCAELLADGKYKNYFLLPLSLTSIGEYAFRNCIKMQSIDMPSSVNVLGEGAFYGDSSLYEISLETINVIPDFCFYGCNQLTTVIFSQSLTSLGANAFAGCLNLTPSFSLINTNFTIGEKCFFNCIPSSFDFTSRLVLSAKISFIGANAFGSTGMNHLIINWTNINQITFGATPFSGTSSFGTLYIGDINVPNGVITAVKNLLPSGWTYSPPTI